MCIFVNKILLKYKCVILFIRGFQFKIGKDVLQFFI